MICGTLSAIGIENSTPVPISSMKKPRSVYTLLTIMTEPMPSIETKNVSLNVS